PDREPRPRAEVARATIDVGHVEERQTDAREHALPVVTALRKPFGDRKGDQDGGGEEDDELERDADDDAERDPPSEPAPAPGAYAGSWGSPINHPCLGSSLT